MKARALAGRFAAALSLLAGVLALLLAALVLEPGYFLTSGTVGRAIGILGRGYQPRWSRLDFEIRSPGPFEKEIIFSTADFCFAKADGSLLGCFKSLSARFTLELSPAAVRVSKISLVEAEGGKLRVDETLAPAKPPARTAFDPFSLPRLLPLALRGVKIEKIAADLPDVEVVQSSATTTGNLRLAFDAARGSALAVEARWAQRSGGAVHRGRAGISLDSDLFTKGLISRLDAKASLRAEGGNAELSATARQAGSDAVALDIKASGGRGGLRFKFRGRGVQTPARYALSGSCRVEASTGPFKSIRLDGLNITAASEEGNALPTRFRLDAALRAEPAASRPVRGFTPPRFVTGKIQLNARASPMARQPDHFNAELSVVLHPFLSWYEAHASLFARASGRTSELAAMRIEQHVDAYLVLARFEDLVAYLASGPFAVPAPLDALRGSLSASFTARSSSMNDDVAFECKARGDLAGERQKLKFHADGGGAASRMMTEGRSIKARASATFDDVALQLPHLDALKMPHVTLDSRIKTGAETAQTPAAAAGRLAEVAPSTAAVALEVGVGTARPIILYTDLTKTPVPVGLDLKFETPPGLATGAVKFQSFDIEFFRRKATVDHLTLSFRPDSKLVGLDGLIKYKATEALISIRLLGTTEKPQVVFESDPPLSQSDIIAMLVFGKSPNDLDPDQAVTVANTQTAMSDEAFGLASLYLFASTPIQFVGYDPATKSYEMKFRIPGGETLQINSDFDSTKSVQLRRRLSKHFAIEAEAVNSQTQGNGVVTFLEWFARY